MSAETTDVAIIGAGPYGLSVAAHLRARGVAVRIFGSPMSFWLKMPATINLKSFAFATNIFVPRSHFTFPEYCRAHGLEDFEPCSMASFAAYGLWVQRELVPEVEPIEIVGAHACDGGFELVRADGERLRARYVVVAVGLIHFARKPAVLAQLPHELVSHSAEHTEFSQFAGRDVAVLGAGSSALESATLLHEANARPLLLARAHEVVFHTKFDPKRSIRERLVAPNSVLGTGRKSWVLDHFPTALRCVPEARRVRFTRSYLGPAGPWWIHDRFEGRVPLRLRCHVMRAEAKGDKVSLEVHEEGKARQTLEFDHVIAGTGFEVDVDRLLFLDPALRARVRCIERSPALSRHFESSVNGLYFVGTAAAFSFGPLFRFVAGAAHAAPAVAKHVASQRRRSFAGPSSRSC